jgi:hypothetical protein
MAGILTDLAIYEIPSVFADLEAQGLTETLTIERRASAADAYGGQAVTFTTLVEEIPAVREPHTNASPRYQNGGEWTTDKFTIPAEWQFEAVDIRATDRVVRLADNHLETITQRTFEVVEVRNVSGVLLELICSSDQNEG